MYSRKNRSAAAPCYLRMLETWGIGPEREGVIEFCAASRAFSPYKDLRPLTHAEAKQVLNTPTGSYRIAVVSW